MIWLRRCYHSVGIDEVGGFVAAIIGGVVAALVGGGLAVATTVGVVNTVQDSPQTTSTEVVHYGER